jgi:hypothetical protein
MKKNVLMLAALVALAVVVPIGVRAQNATPAPAAAAAPAALATPAPAVAAVAAAPQAATPKPAPAARPDRATKATPAPAPDAPKAEESAEDPEPVNVRFEVTVTSQTGSSAPVKRVAVLTVANRDGYYRLRVGNNVPVVTAKLAEQGENGKETPLATPLTSYQWRSIGLNVDINRVSVNGNRLRAMFSVEVSGVDEGKMVVPLTPSFPTFSQAMSLYLESGKPLLVAQSTDYVDNVERKQTVEVKATVLR